jgi:hypothetical protein
VTPFSDMATIMTAAREGVESGPGTHNAPT